MTLCEIVTLILIPWLQKEGDTKNSKSHLFRFCEDVASGQAQGGLLGNWEGTAPNFDSVKDKSCVAILDGKDIGSGPVSTTWLRLHLPHSLHGSFIDRVF